MVAVHSQQFVVLHLYVTEKGVVLKEILEELMIGGFQALRKYSSDELRSSSLTD